MADQQDTEEREHDEERDESSEMERREDRGAQRRERDGISVRASQNTGPDTTATLQPLAEASAQDWLGSNQDPDVLLSIPNLGVDRIALNVENVRAHVELHAKVLDLVELHVGADVSIDKVELEIDNVRVQAMLKVRLEKVAEIVGRVVDLLEHNPEILSNLTRGLGAGLEAGLSRGEHAHSVEEADRMQLGNSTMPAANGGEKKDKETDDE